MESNYTKLAALDVSKHVEKKQGMSYLSWPWAVDQLMRHDPAATWTFHEPVNFGESLMVSCTVTAFGKPMTMHLPVMDQRNQAVKNPDAFAVNKAMMRCLVKAIAVHGLGLYIYAGEDLPVEPEADERVVADWMAKIETAQSRDEVSAAVNDAKAFAGRDEALVNRFRAAGMERLAKLSKVAA